MQSKVESCDPRRLSELLDTEAILPPRPLSEGPGTRIGRYKLLQLIGEGGFGSVFMAEQESPVVRRVALKIIKLGMDTKQVIARFEAERQALAMMDHPNIARVLDAGATDAGRPYFVMELVKGIPITEFCNQSHLPARKRLELFIQVCQAVQHAHQKGIIHRDLKPGNVLVTLHDGTPVPKVIDFGIAKATSQRLTEHTLFTEFRLFIGTPQYMPPEQADISGLDVDTRADIYSLGVLLYELLTDTTPFDPKQLRDSAYTEVQRIIREVEPPKPSTRLSTMGAGLQALAARMGTEPRKLNQLIAGELDWIVMKCLEKDRSQRYETANGLAQDVQRYLDDEPVEASPPSATYRLRKLARKHRGRTAAAGAVLLTLLAGSIGTSLGLLNARHNLAVARLAEERLRNEKEIATESARRAVQAEQKEATERRQADAVAERLESIFHHLDPYAQEKGGPDLRTQLISELNEIATNLDQDGAIGVPVRARLRDSLGLTQLRLGQISDAVVLLQAAVNEERTSTAMDEARKFLTLCHLGLAYHMAGRTAEAIQLLERVRNWQVGHLGPDNADTLETMDNLASAYRETGRDAESLKLFEEIRDRKTKMLGPDGALSVQRDLAGHAVRPAEAIKLLLQVRDAQIKKLGPEHPEILLTLRALAIKYRETGRTDEAIRLLEKVRDEQIKKLGPEHPDVLVTLNELGLAYGAADRHPDEIALFVGMRDTYSKKLGPQHPWTFTAIHNLALAYEDVGQTVEAMKLLEQVRDWRIERLGPDPVTLLTMYNLAGVYENLGRTTEAIQLFEQVREKQLRQLGPDHPDVLRTMGKLGMAYIGAGRTADGVKLLEQVRDSMIRNLGPDHRDTVTTLFNLAQAYDFVGRQAEAVKLFEMLRQQLADRPTDERNLTATYGLAINYQRLGRTSLAVPLLEQARDGFVKTFGPDDFNTGSVYRALALAYRSEGRFEDASNASRAARESVSRQLQEKTNSLEGDPSNAALLSKRGEIYAELGRFREAADDFTKAIELAPDNHRYWHDGLMPLLLQLGDVDGFRRRRGEELRRFGTTPLPVAAHRVAKDAFMIALGDAELKVASELADRALAADPEGWAACQTKGMAEYRSGRYAEAIPWLRKCRQRNSGPFYQTEADLFCAMAYQRLGDRAQARTILNRAVQMMEVNFAKPQDGDVIGGFPEWILCQVLRREAEGMIGSVATTRSSASQPAVRPAD